MSLRRGTTVGGPYQGFTVGPLRSRRNAVLGAKVNGGRSASSRTLTRSSRLGQAAAQRALSRSRDTLGDCRVHAGLGPSNFSRASVVCRSVSLRLGQWSWVMLTRECPSWSLILRMDRAAFEHGHGPTGQRDQPLAAPSRLR